MIKKMGLLRFIKVTYIQGWMSEGNQNILTGLTTLKMRGIMVGVSRIIYKRARLINIYINQKSPHHFPNPQNRTKQYYNIQTRDNGYITR